MFICTVFRTAVVNYTLFCFWGSVIHCAAQICAKTLLLIIHTAGHIRPTHSPFHHDIYHGLLNLWTMLVLAAAVAVIRIQVLGHVFTRLDKTFAGM